MKAPKRSANAAGEGGRAVVQLAAELALAGKRARPHERDNVAEEQLVRVEPDAAEARQEQVADDI